MNVDLYPIGWVHSVASLTALAAGVIVLGRPKGTPVHRRRGRIYLLAMIATCLTSFAIYRRGVFWFPHWSGVAALVLIVAGFAFAHYKPLRSWMHWHLSCMIASYYVLTGGSVNEVFVRVDALRRIVPDPLNSPLVGMTHFAVMIVFALLIAYFNAALLLRRPRAVQ
jgi:uncharacterized membrane protein